jgi:hypothetical protein
MKPLLTAALYVSLSFVTGCVTRGLSSEITSGKATLIPETVNVSPFGANYKIAGIVLIGERRAEVDVYATDCQKGFGMITGNPEYIDIQHVMASGDKPADRLFAQMCRIGAPTALRMDAQLTDQQRMQRNRAAQQAVMGAMAADDARNARQQHDDAIRDAGKSVADAVNQQGSRPTNCQWNGNGYT